MLVSPTSLADAHAESRSAAPQVECSCRQPWLSAGFVLAVMSGAQHCSGVQAFMT